MQTPTGPKDIFPARVRDFETWLVNRPAARHHVQLCSDVASTMIGQLANPALSFIGKTQHMVLFLRLLIILYNLPCEIDKGVPVYNSHVYNSAQPSNVHTQGSSCVSHACSNSAPMMKATLRNDPACNHLVSHDDQTDDVCIVSHAKIHTCVVKSPEFFSSRL